MILGIIAWTIISFTIIALIHHIFSFFKNTLTVPKVKDLVNQPKQLYKEMEETLNKPNNQSNKPNNQSNKYNKEVNNDFTSNNINTVEMKDELKNFFKELNQTNEFNQFNQNSTTTYSPNII